MNKDVKISRTESVLKVLIPEALSTLNDEMLRNLCITDVECSRGKYDAKVFIDKTYYTQSEQEYILSHLKKVSSHLQTYCASVEGWFRCPKFHFKFDGSLEQQNKMDKIFKKVEEELKKNND